MLENLSISECLSGAFFFSPLLSLYLIFNLFPFSRHLSPPLDLPVSFGGRYYVIVGGIEHRSRGSSGLMNY